MAEATLQEAESAEGAYYFVIPVIGALLPLV